MSLPHSRSACSQSGTHRLFSPQITMTFWLIYHQSCKRFHDLAFTKQVWVTLVRHLKSRFFIDLPPSQNLSELSTEDLIALAKRAVQGPQSWSSSNTSSPIMLRREVIDISSRIPQQIGSVVGHHPPPIAKLLPGGRYTLSAWGSSLTCWDVYTKRAVWDYNSHWDGTPSVLNFAAEMIDDGHAITILVCLRISQVLGGLTKYVIHSYHFFRSEMQDVVVPVPRRSYV